MFTNPSRGAHAAPPASGRPKGAGRVRATLTAVAVVGALGLATPFALADHPVESLPGSMFEIDTDANFVVDDVGYTDWNSVTESRQTDLATGQNDNSYKGGVKEDTTCPDETTGSIPNNKSDLKTFGVWAEPGNAPGDPGYLHMFWTRVSDPSGTTLMDFEFNQSNEGCTVGPNKVRTNGDLLFEYSIDQGGARADITLRTWDGTAWGAANPIGASEATGTINQSTISAGDTGGVSDVDLQARTFGEASVDLDVIFDDEKCTSFGSAMLKSRSSDSFTSQLKDFIAPLPINLTNCGKVIIHKETDPDEADVDFAFTKSFGTDPATGNSFTLNDATNDTATFNNVLLGTGYTVSEGTLPDGWDFVSVDCSASVGVTAGVSGATVTFDIDSTTDVLECTFYNEARATLTVVKQVNDDNGTQAFDFTGTVGPFSLAPTGTGEAGEDSQTFGDLAPGDYAVSETVPTGWNLASATCDNGDDPGTITLGAGDDVTCTFVNERERGAILIQKTRKHAAAEGGVGPHAGVTFTITQGEDTIATEVTDADGEICVDGLLYSTGDGEDYTVTETVPGGYVSADSEQDVSVSVEATCASPDADKAAVQFVNTPLTDVTVSVDSLVAGGTASTIVCRDASEAIVVENTDNAPGDVEVTAEDLLPTAPDATLVCTITVDP